MAIETAHCKLLNIVVNLQNFPQILCNRTTNFFANQFRKYDMLTLFDILELLMYLQTSKIDNHDQIIMCCGTYGRTYIIGTYDRAYKTNKTTSTWVTYKIFNKDCVSLGASSLMELNIDSIVFVLMTCLLHKKIIYVKQVAQYHVQV
jgi:hypothetical protein